MQAYARAELVPLEPGFDDRASRPLTSRGDAKDTRSAGSQHRNATSAFAAVLLDGLDDDALAAFASRLVPHLPRLATAAVPHLAFTVASLADELCISQKAIRCAIARGELRALKRGSRWIISADAVNEWANASNPHGTAAPRRGFGASKGAGPSLRSVFSGRAPGGAR